VRTFRRFLAKPVISIADTVILTSVVVAADVLRLAAHLPWWAVLAVAWGGTVLFAFGVAFVKGFGRSVLGDLRRRRAARGEAAVKANES
jgi:hypothetical protein